ncbi:efflux RND transporter periplasmic adaptor subunit [Clostridiaceae bacterium HSG29]|nr:efflux RND transporter periplasmic adaptor subunit [Clostridiaceae bacterium HSG29]
MKISKKGRVAVVGVVLIVLLAVGGYFISQNSSRLDVDYYTIEKGEVSKEISGEGEINSNSISTVYALANGEILKFDCAIGDKIKKGDTVAKINEDNVNYQIEGIDAQIANLNYMLKEAVKPADKESVNSLEYALSSANISLARNKENLNKMQALFDEGAVSLDELNLVNDQNIVLKNQVYSLQNDLASLRKAISSNVELQYVSQIEALEASKNIMVESLDNCEIIALKNGIITEKFIEEGKFVMQGSPVVEITDFEDINIIADVLESEIVDIYVGMEVEVDDIISNEEVIGTVTKVYPKVYEELTELGIKQRKVNVEIKVEGLSDGYLLNQQLDLNFIKGNKSDVIAIPIDSYYEENNKYFVFVNEKGKAISKEIKIGLIGEKNVEIISGLKVGDKIIEVMENEISEGSKIK